MLNYTNTDYKFFREMLNKFATREEAIDKAIEYTQKYGDIVIDDIDYLTEED